MAEKRISAPEVRRLPWPRVLFDTGALSAKEAYEVGRIIVETLWQGRFDRGHQRKEWSVRRLHDVLGVASPARFTRCVQVYEMANELKIRSALDGVSVTTLFLVAGLPKGIRKRLAQQAIREGWSKGRLAEEINREVGPRRSSRSYGPAFVRILASCANEPLLKDLDRLSSLDSSQIRQATRQVEKLLKDLAHVKRALRKS